MSGQDVLRETIALLDEAMEYGKPQEDQVVRIESPIVHARALLFRTVLVCGKLEAYPSMGTGTDEGLYVILADRVCRRYGPSNGYPSARAGFRPLLASLAFSIPWLQHPDILGKPEPLPDVIVTLDELRRAKQRIIDDLQNVPKESWSRIVDLSDSLWSRLERLASGGGLILTETSIKMEEALPPVLANWLHLGLYSMIYGPRVEERRAAIEQQLAERGHVHLNAYGFRTSFQFEHNKQEAILNVTTCNGRGPTYDKMIEEGKPYYYLLIERDDYQGL